MSRGRTGLLKAIKEVRATLQEAGWDGRTSRRNPAATAFFLPTDRASLYRPNQVFREVKFFGDAEIATLRENLTQHKVQLEQLKAVRQVRSAASRKSCCNLRCSSCCCCQA